jgi:hypothetical protein
VQEKKISSTICRIPMGPFDNVVKAGQPARQPARQKVFPG